MLLIFIGYIVTYSSIVVNGFDLLPSFIGYILIYVGLRQLTDLAKPFALAKPWALGLAVISFVCLFPIPLPEVVSILISHSATWAKVFLLLLICIGIRALEQIYGKRLGSNILMLAWVVYTVCNMGIIVFELVLHFFRRGFLTPMFLLPVVSFIAIIVMLVYFYRCHKALQQISDFPTTETPPWSK